jgi:hypothetical protein
MAPEVVGRGGFAGVNSLNMVPVRSVADRIMASKTGKCLVFIKNMFIQIPKQLRCFGLLLSSSL